jgi:flagellar protein FliS
VAKNNPLNAYKETSIKTASSSKLVLMLYNEAIKQMDIAASKLEEKSKDLDNVNVALIKSQDIITELMVSLDFEKGGEIAQNLFSLYMFFNQQLMGANVKKDARPVRNVQKMVMELRDAWAEILKNPSVSEGQSAGGLNIAG